MSDRLPWMQFNVEEWEYDMAHHPPNVQAWWLLVCGRLHGSSTRGSLSLSLAQWAGILRTDVEQAKEFIDYLQSENIADVTSCHGKVTLLSRRMLREENIKDGNRLRKSKQRFNGDMAEEEVDVTAMSQSCHGDVTLMSQSCHGVDLRFKRREEIKTNTNPPIPPLARQSEAAEEKAAAPAAPSLEGEVQVVPKSEFSKRDQAWFCEFWEAYPNRKAKDRAFKAWKGRKVTPELFTKIMSGLERAKTSHDWGKEGGKYIPHPASWLNGGCWEDEYARAGPGGSANSVLPGLPPEAAAFSIHGQRGMLNAISALKNMEI